MASNFETDFSLRADQQLCLVAAMDQARAIGWRGTMPWHLPADLQHFKALTTGHAVVMGRRTWESLPRALPDRHNIVLSSKLDYAAAGVDVCASMSAALQLAGAGTIMIIGGAQLYQLCLPKAQRMELTLIDVQLQQADTWFPAYQSSDWHISASVSRAADQRNPYAMRFFSMQRLQDTAATLDNFAPRAATDP